VLSRFSDENRVFPGSGRGFPTKIAFIHRANAFFALKITFFTRKSRSSAVLTRFSDENHVFHPKITFFV